MENTQQNNGDDESRRVTTSPDMSRLVATGDDYISVKDAIAIFINHDRTITGRTIQRYCEKGHVNAQKRLTAEGEKWFVLQSSLLAKIKELEEFDKLRQDATSIDMSRHVVPSEIEIDRDRSATTEKMSELVDPAQHRQTTTNDMSGPVATGPDLSRLTDREREYLEELIATYKEQIIDLKQDKTSLHSDKLALLDQLTMKDKQIDRFFSSDRDTKTLFGALQNLISTIMPGKAKSDRFVPISEALDSGLAQREHDTGQ